MKRFSLEESEYGSLGKVRMGCDTPLTPRTIKKPFLNRSFAMCIAGPPGSGKTSFALSLLKRAKKKEDNIYHKVFKNILFVSPSSSRASIQNSPLEDLPEDALYDELGWDVEDRVNQLKEQYDKAGKSYSTLLLIDDMGTSLKNHTEMLSHLMMNRRHKALSIILMVQYSISLPKSLRAQISMPIIFKPSKQDHSTIRTEYTDLTVSEYEHLSKFVWKDRHDMLIIDRDSNTYYKNLQKINMC